MVNQKRIMEEFQRLVAFDSESYEEREIADYLKEKLVSLGLDVEEDDAGEKLRAGRKKQQSQAEAKEQAGQENAKVQAGQESAKVQDGQESAKVQAGQESAKAQARQESAKAQDGQKSAKAQVRQESAKAQVRWDDSGMQENMEAQAAGNILGRLAGTVPGEPILLSAHMDTVCPGKGKKAVVHEDGRISSEGNTVLGADDVGGIVSILETLAVIKENNLPHPELEILFLVAEEPYAQGSRVFDYSKVKSKMAYVFDLSGPIGRAAIAAPSILSFQIQVNGKSAHAGFAPEAGVHAIAIASSAISRISNGRIDEDTTVNIGTIEGGTGRNIVPNLVLVTGEIRSMNHEKAWQQAKMMEAEFVRQAERMGGSAETKFEEEFKAYRIEEKEEVVQRFICACRREGYEAELIETFGGSDNNHFAAHGIRGVVAASAMNQVHTTEEYTTQEDLVGSARIALATVLTTGV
jgi:tripeptide aminopeptidase